MASQAPTMTEEQPIAAQEQTLAINPESPDASESGSSPFFQLALIVAVIFPIAWGVGAARLKGATAVTATAVTI